MCFQEQNKILGHIIQRLEALSNYAPTLPEPADIAVVEDEAPALREPVLRAQHQDLVRLKGPVVIATASQVGESIYKRFRCQKPLVFNGSINLAEAEDYLKKIQRIFAYMGLKDHAQVAYAMN